MVARLVCTKSENLSKLRDATKRRHQKAEEHVNSSRPPQQFPRARKPARHSLPQCCESITGNGHACTVATTPSDPSSKRHAVPAAGLHDFLSKCTSGIFESKIGWHGSRAECQPVEVAELLRSLRHRYHEYVSQELHACINQLRQIRVVHIRIGVFEKKCKMVDTVSEFRKKNHTNWDTRLHILANFGRIWTLIHIFGQFWESFGPTWMLSLQNGPNFCARAFVFLFDF